MGLTNHLAIFLSGRDLHVQTMYAYRKQPLLRVFPVSSVSCRYCSRKNSTLRSQQKIPPSIKSEKQTPGSVKNVKEVGAMTRRLAQMAEESRPFKDDPLAGKPWFPDLDPESESGPVGDTTATAAGDNNPDDPKQLISNLIHKISTSTSSDTTEQALYSLKYERQIAQATKIPSFAGPASRAIASAEPWTGSESQIDAANRMLHDTYKPLRGMGGSGGSGRNSPILNGSVTPPSSLKPRMSVSQRLAAARDDSLDYEIKQKVTLDTQESDANSTEKKDRNRVDTHLSHSALFTDFTAIGSLASQRIEDAIARGQFKNLPGRGQKQSKDEQIYLSSPYIDHTEYYLNNMIKRQGASPVWIDKQGGLRYRLETFRKQMAESWARYIVHRVVDDIPAVSSSLPASTPSSEYVSDKRRMVLKIQELVHTNSDSTSTTPLHSHDTWTADWSALHQNYHKLSIESLNSAIRSYNLQAPAAARRGYLFLDKELLACYKHGAQHLLIPELDRFLTSSSSSFSSSSTKDPSLFSAKIRDTFSTRGPGDSTSWVFGKETTRQVHEPYVIKEKGLLKGLFKSLWSAQETKH